MASRHKYYSAPAGVISHFNFFHTFQNFPTTCIVCILYLYRCESLGGAFIEIFPLSLTADDMDFIILAQRAYCTKPPVCQSVYRPIHDMNVTFLETRLKYQIDITPANCCEKCQCDKTCCCGTDDKTDNDLDGMSCVYPQIKQWNMITNVYPHSIKSYWLKDCPYFDIKNLQIHQNCYRQQDESGIFSPPVFDIKNNITYMNVYCAQCNNRSTNFLVPWDSSIECIDGPFQTTTSDDIIGEVLNNTNCNLIFYPPENVMVPECFHLIDRCNVTGKWAVYDAVIVKACSLYTAPYAVLYKNVFCYICNKEVEGNIIEKCNPESSDPNKGRNMLRMLLYQGIDTSSDGIELVEDTHHKHCAGKTIYDALQNKCVMAMCMPPSIFLRGGCVNVARRFGGIMYRMFLVLIPRFTMDNVMSEVNEIDKYITTWLDSIGLLGKLDIISIHEKQQPSCNKRNSIGRFLVVHMDLCIKNQYEELVETTSINKLMNINYIDIHSNDSTKLSTNNYFVYIDHFDLSYNAMSSTITLQDENENGTRATLRRIKERRHYKSCPDLHAMTLYPTSVCPLMILNDSFYNISILSRGVFIGRLNVGLNKSEYIIQDGSVCDEMKCVFVCLDTFNRLTANNEVLLNIGTTFCHTLILTFITVVVLIKLLQI
ncbi:uncharacterized protein LOC132720536 [Ruditapes philippinarum]|uniref:uncharacterized protein LOC132720536 n=1 Tax=Ruditapes philippinarum TaxID=129788 RepID=UPI00295B1F70|nr:uncharacterized protein LOC132720536 [Ruditapes philippinarum]